MSKFTAFLVNTPAGENGLPVISNSPLSTAAFTLICAVFIGTSHFRDSRP